VPRLHLLGTVHLDPDGPRRLARRLAALRPATITAEVSPYALEFRRARGPGLAARLDPHRREDGTLPPRLAALAAQLEIPFEYRIARDHARQQGARVFAVGDSAISRALLGLLVAEAFSASNLTTLAAGELPDLPTTARWERERAARLWDDPLPRDTVRQAQIDQIERGLEAAIRWLAPRGDLVHVGGWEHLAGLRERLGEPEPAVGLV